MFDSSRMNIAIPIDIMALNRRSARPISKRLPHVTLSRCDNDSDSIAHYNIYMIEEPSIRINI